MTTETQVVHLAPTQIREAGEVLARAFHDDPLFKWVLPDESKRARVLPWFMGTGTRYGHMYGEINTTEGKVEGAAVWLPPENFQLTPLRMMRAGMVFAPLKLGPAAFGRFMSTVNHFEHLHKRDVAPRHWYLMILGVDPPRQGQGVGGILIQPVLARADAERLPCYLETVKESNVPFYHKHGFDVVVEGDIPKGGPHFWTMKREPIG